MVSYSTHQFNGNPEDEGAWQAFVAANRESSPVVQKRPSASLMYELILMVMMVGLAAGVIFVQKTTARLVQLEGALQTLQDTLSATQNPPEVNTTSARADTEYTQLLMLHMIETDFFRFVVEPKNLAVVASVISRIDTDYRQLYEDLGLESNSEREKLTVYVTDKANGRKAGPYTAPGAIAIDLSAYTQPATKQASELAQRLYDELFDQLARRTLDEVLSNRKVKPQWGAVIGNLYAYLAQSQLPKSVDELQAHELQRRQLAQTQSLNSTQLRLEHGSWMYPDYRLANQVTDPLVEYIVVTYGRALIPKLIDALGEHEVWDTIAPAVFAISADQLETDWHAYLQKHYPIDSPK
jgi:uncharacterized membrane-anchored protein YhcB (DUF1043 family)